MIKVLSFEMDFYFQLFLLAGFIATAIIYINKRHSKTIERIRSASGAYGSHHRSESQSRRSSRLSQHYAPNYPYALIVIDMQVEFDASRDTGLKQNVIDLIRQAERDGAYVVIASYLRFGRIHADVLDAANRCSVTICHTDGSDKSHTIQEKLGHSIRPEYFKVCGVNLCNCVRDTTEGLTDIYNCPIELHLDACGCSTGDDRCEEAKLLMGENHQICLI